MPPRVSLRSISKHHALGDTVVVAADGVSFDVAEGESVALVGPSGSGKSTLLHLIGGLDVPDAGEVRIDGVDIGLMDDDARSRFRSERVGFVFQEFHLLPALRAWENVAVPMRFARPSISEADIRRRALAALEEVGLGDRADHRPLELSGGQRQRVAIARALVLGPRILLADEPTGNLDAATGASILELFRTLMDRGMTTIIATHDPEVAALCGRTIAIRNGRIA